MTRIMGDAIHDNVPALAAAPVQMVAGYVTGTPDVQWTAADWNLFLEVPRVTIDQGYQSPAITTATVRDEEKGAWTLPGAADLSDWTAQRPTIYVSLSTLPALAAAGWRGDVWVADWTNVPPTSPPVMPAGMTCVAVQYTNKGGGGTYDESIVFDPLWPSKEAPVAVTAWQPGSVHILYSPAGQLQISGVAQDNCIYVADLNPDFTTSVPKQVSAPLTFT